MVDERYDQQPSGHSGSAPAIVCAEGLGCFSSYGRGFKLRTVNTLLPKVGYRVIKLFKKLVRYNLKLWMRNVFLVPHFHIFPRLVDSLFTGLSHFSHSKQQHNEACVCFQLFFYVSRFLQQWWFTFTPPYSNCRRRGVISL